MKTTSLYYSYLPKISMLSPPPPHTPHAQSEGINQPAAPTAAHSLPEPRVGSPERRWLGYRTRRQSCPAPVQSVS